MTAAHRRGARREQQAADGLGAERVKNRPRYQRSPDCVPIRTQDGSILVPESATRAKLPRWFTRKLDQAGAYVAGGVPLVVWSETGGKPYAVMPLEALARLIGLREPRVGEQLSLLLGGPAR